MSDKFFFKGRQDARQNDHKYGSENNANRKSGSKKYPLNLTVTSEARKKELETLVADAHLHANVTLDTTKNAVEAIAELSVILSKQGTVKVDKVPNRNEPCSCGSGKKYKKCCG
jgi:SWIM/SEC-C metal-binding protein